MWLINSSIGRKLVMAVTGVCLVLFVTFHVLMNAVALLWPTAYNQVCEFLGANWYALVASVGLAALFIIHIIYAVWLTLQNRAARGSDRYAVTTRPPQVEWASKNMLVLGIVILAFLVVHLIQFWAKMQLVELRHAELAALPVLNGAPVPPAQGTLFLEMAFKETWTPVVYIIGFVALWFHMNHGFWSMFQSAGWNNQNWLPRLKTIACWWTSIVVGLFIIQAVVFTIQAKNDFFSKDLALQEQYAEYWEEHATALRENFDGQMTGVQNELQGKMEKGEMTMVDAQNKFNEALKEYAVPFIEQMIIVEKAMEVHCPDVPAGMELSQTVAMSKQLQNQMLAQGIEIKGVEQPKTNK